ncbi:MAG: type II toxin-antitoxin system RelE/ParE family toxin [Armatimonadota bacterium]
MLKLVKLHEGRAFTVCALKRTGDEESFVLAYLKQIMNTEKPHWKTLVRRIRNLAEKGPMKYNPEKSRSLQGTDLFELKEQPTRILWFYDRTCRGRIVMTHGFQKRQDKTPPEEIERALQLQAEYYSR